MEGTMKIKNLIALLLILVTSNAYCQWCSPPNPHFKPRQYGFYMPCQSGGCPNPHFRPRQYVLYVPCPQGCMLSCNCTDPACIHDHCCFSCEKCCAAFGNVGAGNFEPLGEPWMPGKPCGERYIPRQDIVPEGAGFAKISDHVTIASQTPRPFVRRPMLHKRMVSIFRASSPIHRTRVYPFCHHHYVLKKPVKHLVFLHRPELCITPHEHIKTKRHPVKVR